MTARRHFRRIIPALASRHQQQAARRPLLARRPAAVAAAAWLGVQASLAWSQWLVADLSQLDTELRTSRPMQPPAGAASRPAGTDPVGLRMSGQLAPAPRGEAARQLPIFMEAERLTGKTGEKTVAEGTARLRRGDLTIRADSLEHTEADNMARAIGNVRVDRAGDVYTGPHLEIQLDTNKGHFQSPTYWFVLTGAGGQADRIDFLGSDVAVATRATYSSCTAEEGETPDWVLTTRRVTLDFAKKEGLAEGATVRFFGVPILGAPVLSFPLSDERKSGWLPPTFDINNRNGFELAVPYYWNIAPNYDATLTPTFSSRRGMGLNTEARYLQPSLSGKARLDLLPNDREADRTRWLGAWKHESQFGSNTDANINLLGVSDDDYWKDYPRSIPGLTRRLLSSTAAVEHRYSLAGSSASTSLGTSGLNFYARAQDWQTLQDLEDPSPSNRVIAPYRRAPQVGAQTQGERYGLRWSAETEVNRFTNEDHSLIRGNRVHALASVAYPFMPVANTPGWVVTPRVRLNAASYQTDDPMSDGSTHASRAIPTVSLDSTWELERDSTWFGRSYFQTLEPRLNYVYTPYRDQSSLPIFDSAPLDFNADSIYADNTFSGIDRVADMHQVSAGVTTRLIDTTSGGEALRLGIVQRYLLRDQRITPDGVPQTRRLSDLLLLASTSVVPNWYFDGTMQYDAEDNHIQRSVVSARYSPGAWRTVGLTYRLTRDANEQVDLGWQWPLAGRRPPLESSGPEVRSWLTERSRANACRNSTLYSVGRVSYSLMDSRITDSLFGVEFDAGCWIGRVVAERISTGQTEATTRLMFQLELVGLSRVGSSPLQALRDNIPGYRLLREENQPATPAEPPEPFHSDD